VAMATGNRVSLDAGTHLGAWRPLIRLWWVIFAAVVVGCLVGLAVARSRTPLYEAQTVVVASTTPIEGDSFGSLAEATFATDSVIQPVIDSLGLDTTVRTLLAGDRLEVEPVPQAVAVKVIGRALDPELASDLANVAATSFASAASEEGLGTFEVFGAAGVPSSPSSRQISLTMIGGGLGGGLLGLAVALAFIFLTRPVLSREDALRFFPAPASFSVKVRLPLVSRLPLWRTRHRDAGKPGGKIVSAIWHAVGSDTDRSAVLCCVDRPGLRKPATRALVERLALEPGGFDASFPWFRVNDNGLYRALREAQSVIAVVSAGASAQALHRLDEEATMTAPEGHRRVLVFVR
jgi:hypothetical protein